MHLGFVFVFVVFVFVTVCEGCVLCLRLCLCFVLVFVLCVVRCSVCVVFVCKDGEEKILLPSRLLTRRRSRSPFWSAEWLKWPRKSSIYSICLLRGRK